MTRAVDPKASERTINSFAYKVLQRVHALGARSVQRDDVIQELWCAWCKARDCFNPEAGASFNTFLHRVMRQHVNKWIEKDFERFHDQTTALSLDAQNGEEGGATLVDIVPGHDIAVEDQMIASSNYEYAQMHLSNRAGVFLKIMAEQPQALLEQVRLLEHKAEHAKRTNIPYAQSSGITSSMIFDLMDAGSYERTQLLREVHSMAGKLSK